MTGSEQTSFFVPGIPAPQGSKRAYVRNGKAVLTESAGDKHKAWRALVTLVAATEGTKIDADAYSVTLTFYLPRPKAARKRTYPHARPDLDKLIRSTLDGLTDAGTIVDDARVVTLTAHKLYAEQRTGCAVHVEAA